MMHAGGSSKVGRVAAAAVALVLAGLPAWAGFSGTDVFLPMVGRGLGVGSAQWYTKVWAYNPNAVAAVVTFYLLERDKANAMTGGVPVTIPAGDTLVWDNAVGTLFGKSGWGAIRVTSDQKVVVNERFYAKPVGATDKSTVGQDYAGIPRSFAIGAGERTDILGTYQTVPAGSSEQRYNFGFVETEGALTRVRVTPMDATGAALASAKEYEVLAYSQRQLAFATAFPNVSTTNARLSVEVVSGTGKVIAYGTGIANTSQDPTTFEMQFKDTLLSGGSGGLTAVSHDTTLTGDGTSATPLGVAVGGVTPALLSTTGSTSGQVLTSSGSAASWQDATGLTLPFSASQAGDGGPLFAVMNTGVATQWGFPVAISASATTSSGMALDATASGGSTIAIRGLATTTGAILNYGGYFESYGTSGRAVAGLVNGSSATGVYGESVSTTGGTGVYGKAAAGYGVYGTADTNGYGMVGDATSTEGGVGVLGRHTSTGNFAELGALHHGVRAMAFGTNDVGVYGSSTHGDGLAGVSSEPNKSGVYGVGTDEVGFGVYGYNSNTRNRGYLGGTYGVYAESATTGAGIYAAAFKGNVAVLSKSTGSVILELGEGLDYAEGFEISEAEGVAPGSVLVIDECQKGKLHLSGEAYDRKVAGIVAGANGLSSGVKLGRDGLGHSVALAGRVYCNVDAGYGEVSPGDLLTTSPTPGYAMAVRDHAKAQGAILGKAMEALAAGRKGQILVLVTLQ